MLRREFVDRYNDVMVEAFSELFNTARKKMFHPGDLLLCQQNGTMFGKDTVIGLGEEGLNSLQKINTLFYNGIGCKKRSISTHPRRGYPFTFLISSS